MRSFTRRLVFASLPAALLASLSSAPARADLYVDAASAGGDGSKGSPFALLSEAVAAVGAGANETIHVAAGTYDDNVGTGEDEYGKGASYTFLGGYSAGFADRDPAKNATVVQAADPARPVFWFFNAKSVTIDGFTIQGGKSGVVLDGWSDSIVGVVRGCRVTGNGHFTGSNYDDGTLENGGGIRIEAPDATVAGCLVENNHGAGFGGGIYVGASDKPLAKALVDHNVVRGNVAHGGQAHGGGIWVSSSGTVRGNVITDNEVDNPNNGGPGGGLIVVSKGIEVLVEQNLVANNHALSGGGGIFVDEEATATLVNNVVVKNRADKTGSGVDVDGASSAPSFAHLRNNTIAFNGTGANPQGEGLFVRGLSQVDSKNDLFFSNDGDDLFVEDGSQLQIESSSFTAADTTGIVEGPGNLSVDPGFSDPDMLDLHVAPASPAVDVGTSTDAPATDFDCIPRPQGAGVDIGAFEVHAASVQPVDGCVPPVTPPPGTGTGGSGANGSGGGSGTGGGPSGGGAANGSAGGGEEDDGCGCRVVASAEGPASTYGAVLALAVAGLAARRLARRPSRG